MQPHILRLLSVIFFISAIAMLVVGIRVENLSFLKFVALFEVLTALVFYLLSIRR